MTGRAKWGAVKQVVAKLSLGQSIVVPPQHAVAHHNAARRMGYRLASTSAWKNGELVVTMIRIAGDWPSGHRVCRLPRRDQLSGRWLRGSTLPSPKRTARAG